MELINRYVYAVTHKLPEKQRADIKKELHGLIEDMLEERALGAQITPKHVEEVLQELGNPSSLAARYRGTKRYLISPELFDMYLIVLKVVGYSILFGLSVVFAIQAVISPMDIMDHFLGYMVSLVTAAVHGFAWVTLTFAILEYSGVHVSQFGVKAGKGEWKVSHLQPIPDRRAEIKISEPIASIVFCMLLVVLFIFSRDLLGVHVFSGGKEASTVIPFLDEAVLMGYLPLLYILIGISLVREMIKLVLRKWSMKLVFSLIIFNIAYFLIAIPVFTDQAVWNAAFMNDLVQAGLLSAGSEDYNHIDTIWSRTTGEFIYIVGAVLVMDSVMLVVKGFQARNSQRAG